MDFAGAVRGGKVLNDYPESLLEGNNQAPGGEREREEI